mmetsp:Transcript_21128/g.50184  ORF Transcript_21128/g.50184 Transcript_21128/m.50184 type:complete len:337 (+) Transcript_21128:185-1195(+)
MQKMEEVGKRVRQNEGTNAENSDEASSSTGQGPQTGPAAERDEQPLETSAKKIRQQGAHSAQSGGGGGGKDASHVSANAQTSEPSSSAVSEPDYKMLYLKEIEKNKHLLQWILQLQSQLRNQMLDVCHPVASSPAAGIQQGAWAAKAKTADREGKDDGAKSETDTTSSSSVAGSPTAKSEQLPQQPSVKKAETSEPSGADGSSENQGAHAAGRSEETPSAARSRENATLDEGSPSDLGPLSQVSLVHDVSYTKEPDPAAMARTCCARCGTGFAFSRAFLSQRDFLVLPCPNCHVTVAIPPFPGAAPHKPRGMPLLLELNWHLSAATGPPPARAQHG